MSGVFARFVTAPLAAAAAAASDASAAIEDEDVRAERRRLEDPQVNGALLFDLLFVSAAVPLRLSSSPQSTMNR